MENVADPTPTLEEIEKGVEGKNDHPVIEHLSKHIDKVWKQNQKTFKPTRQRMIELLRRTRGEYDAKKLAAIRAFKGTEVFFRNGENKARTAESWIKDIYRGDSDFPWVLDPTTVPELPDETDQEIQAKVLQEAVRLEQEMIKAGLAIDKEKVAEIIQEYYEEKLEEAHEALKKESKERVDKVADEIRDDNEEGGWNSAFKDFLWYFTRLPFGVIKGPILTQKKRQVWEPTEQSYQIVTKDVVSHDVYCVSPFNIYPSSDIKSLNDGDIIEIHELSRESLYSLIGVDGYDEAKIRAVLTAYDKGSLKGKWFTVDDETALKQAVEHTKKYDTDPPTQNSNFGESVQDLILAQEFYGTVRGKWLMDWGLKEELDPDRQYQANCWKIGEHVIKAVINPDSLGRKPYHSSSWAKNPETWVGEGLVEFGAPVEDAMNAVVRALINNIAIASGPMAEIDKDRVDATIPIYPWRQIASTSRQMRDQGPAVTYYQPQMHAQELITAYTFFSRVLDELTVPAYAQGQNQTGVTAGTATVFTELLAAASRSTKAVVANVDDDIIEPYIQMCYDYKLKFNPDLKADAKVVTKGVQGLTIREQQAQRKVEYLQIAMTPVLSQILGAKNLGSIAAQIAKANNISLPDMKRLEGEASVEEMVQQMLMAQSGIDPVQQNGQVANGGGAPSKPQGTKPNGAKAGVNNAA